MLDALLKLVFPERCVHCDSDYGDDGLGGVCRTCEENLHYFGENLCGVCGWPFRGAQVSTAVRLCRRCRTSPPAYRSLRALGWYEGVLGSTVKAAKFSGNRQVFERWIPGALALMEGTQYDAVVSVPSDHALNRDLSERLASSLDARVIAPVYRLRDAKRQVGLSRRERRANARSAFARHDVAVPQAVLLIDDIVTTGASLDAVAALLAEGGAGIVDVFAVGRARS